MKPLILHTSLIIPILGMHILTTFAGVLPTTPPSGSSTGVNGIFTQFFENISTPVVVGNTNPILIGFNTPTHASPMMPIYLTDSQFVTTYLKTLGALGGDMILNGFDINGNMVGSSMDTMVKNFLGSTYAMAPSRHGVRGFDATGNMITSQNIGYWDASGLGINYSGWNVRINGSIRLYGNATSKNATDPNHLVTYGQVQSQITSIKNAIP